MNKEKRNTLKNVVTQCRVLLEEAIDEILEGQFGIHSDGVIEEASRLTHLSPNEQEYREHVRTHLEHIKSFGQEKAAAVEQLKREAAFTHLNRLCAYKMMAQRKLIDDAIGKELQSRGFIFYLAEQEADEKLYNTGREDVAYRHYFEWLNTNLSREIGVLFAPDDLASGLFPPHKVLIEVIRKLNQEDLAAVWTEDETIGWVYQYFTPEEMRRKARKANPAPKNSYEMAFRNQFFTPRYVVEFLTDNTLGRTWYEMCDADTALKDKCKYLVTESTEKLPRQKKDPREIKVLDPACGSGHFLLYCFDVLQAIYDEAYKDAEIGAKLQKDFPEAESYRKEIPRLILEHNLHGIDIDLRVTQLAALALWLRAQRAFKEMGLPKMERPKIEKMNLVCAEPMPGEADLLAEFKAELEPRLLGDLVEKVFERMKLAGEAGALVRIEDDIREPLEKARKKYLDLLRQEQENEDWQRRSGALFDYRPENPQQRLRFYFADIKGEEFWNTAESRLVKALEEYARRAGNGEGLRRKLFAKDAEQGFAFIDLCRKKFDVVLMNPPFGDASQPSKPYIDDIYGDTKGDVYKAFVECFQDRLVPGGYLGIISSRTGFFLSGSFDWRERIVLRLYRPLLLADFGMGVLDAMVETAAYVLRSLTQEEDRELTMQLFPELEKVPTDKKDFFSTKKYEAVRGLKRHQANGELRRLQAAGFIESIEGNFPRWSPFRGAIAKAKVPESKPYPPLVCLRIIGEKDKKYALENAVSNENDKRHFVVSPEDFRQVPNMPFCYWVSNDIRRLFVDFQSLENSQTEAQHGLSTKNDFRFIRVWWEVPTKDLCLPLAHPKNAAGNYCVISNHKWFSFAKGGAYSPFYTDLHLVVNWWRSGSEIEEYVLERYSYLKGNASWILHHECNYFKPGLTWTRRTTSPISFRVLPAGCLFSDKGPAAFAEKPLSLLGLIQSSAFSLLLSVQLAAAEGAARSYEDGVIKRTPICEISSIESAQIQEVSNQIISIKRELDTSNQISHIFHLPALLQVTGEDLKECAESWQNRIAESEQQLAEYQCKIDDIAFKLYGIGGDDRRAIEESITRKTTSQIDEIEESETGEETDEAEDEAQPTLDGRALTADLISYAVGCAFGRWDARFATRERAAPELPDPFAALPVCAPGALQGADGLPLAETPENYPLRIDWDGILVDDANHQTDDIIARIREVFQLIWSDQSEAREREACELLNMEDLRSYFRRSGTGGFWDSHIKRYSKSKRKAPIYWLLQSSRRNYAIWLYYHQLSREILYIALKKAEDKLRLEENNLGLLTNQRAVVGTTGSAARQLESKIDKQETLLSELRDFRDKLKRAAEMNLDFDLNDGVVLNIAPLYELVPWAEAKKYWNELIAGKYEWSSMSKQLWEKGFVKK